MAPAPGTSFPIGLSLRYSLRLISKLRTTRWCGIPGARDTNSSPSISSYRLLSSGQASRSATVNRGSILAAILAPLRCQKLSTHGSQVTDGHDAKHCLAQRSPVAAGRYGSVKFRQVNAGVIGLENLFGGVALPGQTVSADLAHADAVAPAAPGEHESSDAIIHSVNAIHHEELFPQ